MRVEPPIGHTEAVRAYFRRAFQGKDPYPFQLEIIDRLLAGENVVALAPTGAGKTLAPVAAFAYARERGLQFADRLVYALPQRTLAMALWGSVTEDLKKAAPDLRVTVQTGNSPDDPYFEGDVIFTTIDQLLGAYIEVPVSLPGRLANVPAGALLGSLLVFDEFHLMEPTRALATALDMARQLSPHSQTLLMSATFARSAVDELLRRANAALVHVDPEELDAIPSQRNKRRTYRWHPEPISAQAVLDAHRNGARTIVVVNRVDRAQDLADEIQCGAGPGTRVLLLHSRFLPEDRRRHEQEVIERFQRGGIGRAILVATQVVEVGLDISCDTMHTEVAPASALFQRAGRCARYENETGTVHVYQLEVGRRGRRYGPYKPDSQIVDAVVAHMAACNEQVIDFRAEQQIVNLTHGDVDLQRLMCVSGTTRRADVARSQRSHELAYVRKLIREVDSVSLLVHPDPAELQLARRPETFSLHRGVLRQLLKDLDLSGRDEGRVTWPEFPANSDGYRREPDWRPLLKAEDADDHFLLALHPSLVSYDSDRGLRLLPSQPRGYQSRHTLDRADARVERYSYQKELHSEHARLVAAEMDRLLTIHHVAISRVSAELGIRPEDLQWLSRLVGLLHDAGKLTKGVQEAMWCWMREVHCDYGDGLLAHTTFDAEDRGQRILEREARFRKPPHAAEGAWAARPAISVALRRLRLSGDLGVEVATALVSAVARHHNPSTGSIRSFTLATGAQDEVDALLAGLGLRARLADGPSEVQKLLLQDNMIDPEGNPTSYPLYLLVVRLLRMADQRATARKE